MRFTSVRKLLAFGMAGLAVTISACGGGDGSTEALPGAIPALHDALPDSVKEAGVIRFVGDSHPPYRTVQPGGEVTGIDADFQAALGRVLGVRTEMSIIPGLPAALQGMLAGRADIFNGPVEPTAEREKQFDSVTWMKTYTSYVVPATTGITAIDQLCGKRVAIVEGSVVAQALTTLSSSCTSHGANAVEVLGLTDTNSTLLAVDSGRADAAGMTQVAALDTTKQKDKYTAVTQTEAQGSKVSNLALLTPKTEGLGQVLLDAYRQLFTSGEYQRIMDRWGLSELSVPEPILNAGTVGTR